MWRHLRTLILSLGVGAVAVAPVARADVPVVGDDHLGASIGAMGQVLGLGQHVQDPYKDDYRAYLFLKEARFRASGHLDDFTLNLELALGGEDVVVAPSPGIALTLLDLSFNIPLHVLGSSYIKVGQFKVPYGRERLTYSGDMMFIDRSVQDVGFVVGRDVGAAITLRPGPATLIAGLFTGGGRDVPQRYLPERLGVPMVVVRAGVGNADQNPYELKQDVLDLKETQGGFFVNGLYTKDSLLGHSTVLNVKNTDKSVLLNGNWNPYIGKAPFSQGDWWQAGADAIVRTPVGRASLFAEGEVNYAGFSNGYGALHAWGARAQGGVLVRRLEVALRYSALFPSDRFAVGANPITGTTPIHEVTPALTYYILGQNLKVMADLPVLFQAPVVTEPNVGSYVATQVQDQVKVLGTGGTVARQNVVQGRLMVQGRF